MNQDQYPDTPFQRWLAAGGACYDARKFVSDKTPQQAWDTCHRPDWMAWLITKIEPRPVLSENLHYCTCGARCGGLFTKDGAEPTIEELRSWFLVLPDFLSAEQPVQVDNPPQRVVYHAITPDATWTYLDAERRAKAWRDGEDVVFTESQVTETVYGQLREWRLAGYQSNA